MAPNQHFLHFDIQFWIQLSYCVPVPYNFRLKWVKKLTLKVLSQILSTTVICIISTVNLWLHNCLKWFWLFSTERILQLKIYRHIIYIWFKLHYYSVVIWVSQSVLSFIIQLLHLCKLNNWTVGWSITSRLILYSEILAYKIGIYFLWFERSVFYAHMNNILCLDI